MDVAPRLEGVLSMLTGGTLADIGTDHAYLPITACKRALAVKCIACDINPGPLESAKKNIARHGLTHAIETRLGSGLRPLTPGEADTIVIAGIGGMKIIGILNEFPETAKSAGRLILQPQRDVAALRKALHESSYDIHNEKIIKEGERFYLIIAARPAVTAEPWHESDYLFGKILPERGGDIWQAYLRAERGKIERYLHTAGQEAIKALETVNKFLKAL
jgi:tRNA (adenine22-N1)-methyltransferase